MKSPITGKKMVLKKEPRRLSFRKESFEVVYHYYLCEDTGAQFEDDNLTELNITQVHNKYREQLKLPFPDEIIAIRKKYYVSARKMSDILGFGTNTYGNYEKGEIPSKVNSRLIQMANDPDEFRKLAEYSGNLSKELNKKLIAILQQKQSLSSIIEEKIFKMKIQSSLNGYRMFDREKVFQMIIFFAEILQPWKTKLNKLLFYSDFYHYKYYGFSISGLKYAPINYGPVPDDYELLFNVGRKDGFIKNVIKEINKDITGEVILPMRDKKFDAEMFDSKELETLNTIVDKFKDVSTSDIVRMTHEEKAWKENYKKNPVIDYEYGFDLIHV